MNDATYNALSLTLKRFVDWAHEQGWRYQMAPVHLRHLQRFLQRHGVKQLGEVNAALLGEYQRRLLVHRSSTTVTEPTAMKMCSTSRLTVWSAVRPSSRVTMA